MRSTTDATSHAEVSLKKLQQGLIYKLAVFRSKRRGLLAQVGPHSHPSLWSMPSESFSLHAMAWLLTDVLFFGNNGLVKFLRVYSVSSHLPSFIKKSGRQSTMDAYQAINSPYMLRSVWSFSEKSRFEPIVNAIASDARYGNVLRDGRSDRVPMTMNFL